MARMTKKETRVQVVSYDDGATGLDLRDFRKYEGVRDWRAGKGLFVGFTSPEDLRAKADALMAAIEREVCKVERAAVKVPAKTPRKR